MFLNPQGAPLFMFDVIKSFNESEKKLILTLYKKIAKYEIDSFGLEAEYDEKREADLVKRLATEWKDMSAELTKIYSAMKGTHETSLKKLGKSYVG